MPTTKKYTDHNGKEVRIPNGKNVRVSTQIHKTVSAYALKKGLKVGKFFELAATEKMFRDK